PSDQSDFLTATKFVNALIRNGVTVLRAASQFTVGGKTYPSGSYVIKTAQAFRPQVLDMFEPQDHPNDFAYAGAPPTPPYDIAGWTLAYQMGVSFDAISKKPSGDAFMLRQPRIGLWDRYGGSIPSGWTRYVLEKFEFPYTVVYDDDLRQGDLGRKFDVLIFVNDTVVNPAGALRGFLQQGGTILAI